MASFDFKTNLEDLDNRSIFANRICKLIYKNNNNNLNKAIVEAKPYFDDMEDLIRNIYELVDTEIPMYAYYELVTYGIDNWWFDEFEYKTAIEKTILACKLYYE